VGFWAAYDNLVNFFTAKMNYRTLAEHKKMLVRTKFACLSNGFLTALFRHSDGSLPAL
jgi:hypothetical protein